jgi:exodeoxyribonuclease VII small subunit
MTFEESLARLDEIIELLNDGTPTLEESLKLYAEGTELLRTCTARLEEAHTQIETLSKAEES